eukprot:6018-Heterococcus_DN1.PRE.2
MYSAARDHRQLCFKLPLVCFSPACAAGSAGLVRLTAIQPSIKQAKMPDAQESALSQKGILAKVLRYVHPTQWLYVVLVSKAWLESFRHNYNPDNNTILAKVGFSWSPTERDYVTILRFPYQLFTKASAALEPVSRREVAHQAGLDLLCSKMQRTIGKSGSAAVLIRAHELGMPWTDAVAHDALRSRSLSRLQGLVVEHDCPVPADCADVAASVGSFNVLHWLKQRRMPLDVAKLGITAAANGHWLVLQYLRRAGLQWNKQLCVAAGHLTIVAERTRMHMGTS